MDVPGGSSSSITSAGIFAYFSPYQNLAARFLRRPQNAAERAPASARPGDSACPRLAPGVDRVTSDVARMLLTANDHSDEGSIAEPLKLKPPAGHMTGD